MRRSPESEKDVLRAEMRALRESLGERERGRIDALIVDRLTNMPSFAISDAVYTYLSMGAEVDTRRIVERAWKEGKRVAIPRCISGRRDMRWHWISSFDGLVRSRFGIDEPAADDPHDASLPASDGRFRAVAIVPGYSFDREGFRLGYGGGFYDAFLPQFVGTSIGLCRDCQISAAALPRDGHDCPVDVVVTETGAYSR